MLDGVVPPDITITERKLGKAQGREQATQFYVRNDVTQGISSLGDRTSLNVGIAASGRSLRDVDAHSLLMSGQCDVTQLTEGWTSSESIEAMCAKQSCCSFDSGIPVDTLLATVTP